MLALREEAIQHCIERTRPFVQSSDKKSAFTENNTAPTDIGNDDIENKIEYQYQYKRSAERLKKSLDQPFSGEDVIIFQ